MEKADDLLSDILPDSKSDLIVKVFWRKTPRGIYEFYKIFCSRFRT